MKIEISTSSASAALKIAGSVTGRRQVMPLLSCVRLSTDPQNKKVVSLKATDINNFLICNVEALTEVKEELDLCLDAALLRSIVNEFSGSTFLLEVEKKGRVVLKSEKTIYRVNTVDPTDFPAVPVTSASKNPLVLQDDFLFTALRTAAPFASKDGTRFQINSVFLEGLNNGLNVIATDGRALFFDRLVSSGYVLPSAIVSLESVKMIESVLSSSESTSLSFVDNYLCLETPGATLYSRLVAGAYPDYAQVLPKQVITTILVEREQLLTAARRVAVTQADIVFKVKGNTLTLTSESPEVGEAVQEVTVESCSGNNIDIMFGQHLIFKALSKMEGTIKLEFSDSFGPLKISATSGESFSLIMPKR